MLKTSIIILFTLMILGGCASTDESDNTILDRSQNLLATGDSANDLLTNTNFDRLLVQIGYVSGFQPTQQTIDEFKAFIIRRTFKNDVDIQLLELRSPNEESLTLQEIADLERENRTAYNNETTLAIYIYFSDSISDGDDLDTGLVTLGAVYRNTSMVIFERTIRALAGRSMAITTTDLETATLIHELGHLFGLVNLGTPTINDHEDPDAENHCSVEGCLMLAELTFDAINKNPFSFKKPNDLTSVCNLSGNTMLKYLESRAAKKHAVIPDLDAECILDLQSNGGR